MDVDVIYAPSPGEQHVVPLAVDTGCSVEAAILQSNILSRFPEIDLGKHKVGIFNKLCQLSHPLREGDRIEIYRPLKIDPKDLRRKRA